MTENPPYENVSSLCQEGMRLARSGNKAAALAKFRRAVALDPTSEVAWLHLAGLAGTPDEAQEALAQVERLNPNNPHLQNARVWLKKSWPEAGREPDTSPALAEVSTEQAPVSQEDAASSKAIPSEGPIAPEEKKKRSLILWSLTGLILVMLLGASLLFAPVANVRSRLPGLAALLPTPTNTMAQTLEQLWQAVDTARARSNQQALIDALEKMYALDPYDEEISGELARLHYERGLILRNGGNFEAAQQAFNQALAIQETLETAQLEQQQINYYLSGVAYYQNGRWAEAIAAFEQVYKHTPDYPFMREIMYSAYFNQGMALEANRDLEVALDAFKRAAQVMPLMTDTQDKIKAVSLALNPPTPTPDPTATLSPTAISDAANKRVVVDISEQRAYTYAGEKLVHKFIISTGEAGRDTAIGQFEIQNKIPVAYASTWNLDMPFWLGIYWSGPLQNGFHAVPTVRHTGLTMWDGYLGQRVSYGCVILSMKDAETLYDWVDIGTPVTIQW